jgi:hypothetical protein
MLTFFQHVLSGLRPVPTNRYEPAWPDDEQTPTSGIEDDAVWYGPGDADDDEEYDEDDAEWEDDEDGEWEDDDEWEEDESWEDEGDGYGEDSADEWQETSHEAW